MVSTQPEITAASEADDTRAESPLTPSFNSTDNSNLEQDDTAAAGASLLSEAAASIPGGFHTPRAASPRGESTQSTPQDVAEASLKSRLGQAADPEGSGSPLPENRPWIVVGRNGRDVHSPRNATISPAKQATVRQAEELLTDEQRARISRRNVSVSNQEQKTLPPDKGKSVDPREYGGPSRLHHAQPKDPVPDSNADNNDPLAPSADDLAAQKAALDFWNTQARYTSTPKPTVGTSPPTISSKSVHPNELSIKDLVETLREMVIENQELKSKLDESAKSRHTRFTPDILSKEYRESIERKANRQRDLRAHSMDKEAKEHPANWRRNQRRVTRPNELVPTDSSLGRLFSRVSRRHDDSSDDPSSSSSSSDDDDLHPKRAHEHRRRKKKKRSPRAKPKIEPPSKFSGGEDPTEFHRWVREGVNYLDDIGADSDTEIRTLARFTEGKAQTFYLNTVADDERNWTLDRYFRGVFDACFPANFREKQRRKLERFYQNEMSVKEYAAQLKELINTVGEVDKRQGVVHLFRGLNEDLRIACRRMGLNPEDASWDDVIAEAENEEFALSTIKKGPPRPNKEAGRGPKDASSASKGDQGRVARSPNHSERRQQKFRHFPRQGEGGGNLEGRRASSSAPNSSSSKPSAASGSRPRLLPEERRKLQSEGKCFICRQLGHISRNCPKANLISAKGNKPPGLQVNAIGVDFEEHIQRDEYVSDPEPELSLNMMGPHQEGVGEEFKANCEDESAMINKESAYSDLPDLDDLGSDISSDSEGWSQDCWASNPDTEGIGMDPDAVDIRWNTYITNTYREGLLGDAGANAQTWMLELARIIGFPGDPNRNQIPDDEIRFVIARANCHYHVLSDRQYPDRVVPIESYLLLDPGFNIATWYAQHLCLPVEESFAEIYNDFSIDALGFNARMYLHSWFGPEAVETNSGFNVEPLESLEDSWHISEHYSLTQAVVPGSILRNERVNFAAWYLNHTVSFACDPINVPRSEVFDVVDVRGLYDPNDGGLERALDALAEFLVTPEGSPWSTPPISPWSTPVLVDEWEDISLSCTDKSEEVLMGLPCFGVQIDREAFPAIQRNSSVVKDPERALPRPVVVTVKIDGRPAKALLDSGSLGDFMSTSLADQLLGKRKIALDRPLPLQLAVQGSRSKVNWACRAEIEYQTIKENRHFDVINISNYDLILGTPWIYQHRVMLGLNPTRVVVGSSESLPMDGPGVSRLASMSVEYDEDAVERARQELREYAKPLCRSMDETPLPPLRDINHTIPLIDESKVYSWRPSRCPEPLRAQWVEKRNAYLKSGRWKVTSSGNAVPMMHVYKPGTELLRVVVDLRERNANTRKMASPMPEIEGILRRVAKRRWRSTLDGKDAYEQIRIVPEHVPRSVMTTPDGNMVSLVMQQGDCNAPATYQALMNHIFGPYIGKFMDVYLDDIIVYSDTLGEHVAHVKIVIDVLTRERLYLSEKKLHFLQKDLRILGRIVDDEGIRMDPHKVDSVLNWKVPTNRDLLRGFLGAVGYLADDVACVRIPMGILTSLTGDKVPFRWEATHQRAFDEVKLWVHRFRGHRRRPLVYGIDGGPIWLITDASATGVAGVISQGIEWRSASIAAFFSAKLNPAQQNYAVHEIEMLAGLETMMRHRDILQGAKFTWLTDHKGLVHLLKQKNLSGRQLRWMGKMSEFNYTVEYIPGTDNVLSDALSRIYSNDAPGSERAFSEYVEYDVGAGIGANVVRRNTPVLVAGEARAESLPLEGVSLELNAIRQSTKDARAFARRMVSKRFVLRGPRERKEGEGGNVATKNKEHNETPLRAEMGAVGTESNLIPSIERVNPVDAPEAGPSLGNFPAATTSATSPSSPTHLPDSSVIGVANSNHKRTYGVSMEDAIRGQYTRDLFFNAVIQNPRQFKNFELVNGLLYLVEDGRRVLCIPDVVISGRTAKEIVVDEGHSLLAHLGPAKTLTYLREFVWWKHLSRDVYNFCNACITCRRSKPSNQKPYGLLNPLPVPSRPWDAIGIDFVGPLPKSSNRDAFYDSITVIIDLLTAMVHLVPSRTTYGSIDVAELVFAEVYKHHGLPRRIISDRDSLFNARFWRRLHDLIGTRLNMSSAYHPESDGSTERANRTITQMIRSCVSADQRDWVRKLPAIEFAINSARSNSTGFAPFFLNTGRMPRPLLWNGPAPNEAKGIREFAETLRDAIIVAHDSILAARTKQTRDANRRRQPASFAVNDLVYISSQNISFPQGLARKLVPKYIGPFRITRTFGNDTFGVDLPTSLVARGIHPSFHSSLLRIHVPNDDRLFPGRSIEQLSSADDNGRTEWKIKEIISHSGQGQNALFEIRWPTGDKTWLPYHKISHLEGLRRYFEILGISNINDLPRGSGTPPDDVQLELGLIFPTNYTDDEYITHDHSTMRRPSCSTTLPTRNPSHQSYYPSSPNNMVQFGPIHRAHSTLSRRDDGTYVLRNPSSGRDFTFTVDEVLSFISYSKGLFQGWVNANTPLPPRYLNFAEIYNMQNQITCKFNIPSGGICTNPVRAPSLRFLGIIPGSGRHSNVTSTHRRGNTSNGTSQTAATSASRLGPAADGSFTVSGRNYGVLTNVLLGVVGNLIDENEGNVPSHLLGSSNMLQGNPGIPATPVAIRTDNRGSRYPSQKFRNRGNPYNNSRSIRTPESTSITANVVTGPVNTPGIGDTGNQPTSSTPVPERSDSPLPPLPDDDDIDMEDNSFPPISVPSAVPSAVTSTAGGPATPDPVANPVATETPVATASVIAKKDGSDAHLTQRATTIAEGVAKAAVEKFSELAIASTPTEDKHVAKASDVSL